MTLAEQRRTLQNDALATDVAFLSIGYINDGQADGPYPDMYEYSSHHHTGAPLIMPKALAQGEA